MNPSLFVALAFSLAPPSGVQPPGSSSLNTASQVQGTGSTTSRPRVEIVEKNSTATTSPQVAAKPAGGTQSVSARPAQAPSGAGGVEASAPSGVPRIAPMTGSIAAVEDVEAVEPPASQPGDELPAGSGAAQGRGRRAGPVVENYTRPRTAVLREPPPELVFLGERKAPSKTALMTFGYRHFSIVDGLARQQGWHLLTFELTPLRRYFRLNFATELGVEGGEAAANHDRGDFIAMEKIGLGMQIPGWLTPYFEFQGGAGVGRIELFDRNDLGIMMSTGLDVGVQWAVARSLFLSASVGWIRPVVMTTEQSLDEARAFNRGTFKIGVGF